MSVRVPQPPHGWRVLAWEVGVVVVGVLIALGAQQFADTLSWSGKIEAQRAALDAGIEDGIGAVALRRHWQPCLNRRLVEIDDIFNAHAAGRAIGVTGRVGAPYTVWDRVNAYEDAVSDGSLARMPLATRRYYEDIISNIRNAVALEEQEFQLWLKLQRLDRPERMDESDWSDMRGIVGEARLIDQRLRTAVKYTLARLRKGQQPKDLRSEFSDEPWGDDFCKPLLAPEAG